MAGLPNNLIDLITTVVGMIPLKMLVGDVDNIMDYSFIDENFHYPQQQAYCRGDYDGYDPKLTTPPGLYYLGALYNMLTDKCDLSSMRYLNFLGAFAIAIITHLIRTKLTNAGFMTLSVVLNPLIALYYSLFYTDVWSSVFVLAGYAIAVTRPFDDDLKSACLSAAFGAVSCFFRQTNIIWCAFSMVALLDARAQSKKLYTNRIPHDTVALIKSSLKRWPLFLPYAVVGLMFCAFLVINGGITMGDKENHVMTFHLMQLFYCVTFFAVFTIPLWASFSIMTSYIKENFMTNKGLFFNAWFLPTLAYVIHDFTIIHPFVLADNRHYTFYIVRRFIMRSESSKYELIPIYHFSCYIVWELAKQSVQPWSSSNSSLIMFLALLGASAITIIPTPLFEPRYYIVPFMFYRLMINPSFRPVFNTDFFRKYNNSIRLILEVVWTWMWSQALYEIMLTYSFRWEDEPNPQRVIW